jgi:glycosyltransferase involved in cell wall biosynthesis
MAKKLKLGLNLFFDNKSNSGVVNYIFNIVSALKTLAPDEQPQLSIFYSRNAPIDYIKSIGYPDVNFVLIESAPHNWLLRKLNSLIYKLTGQNLYKQFKYSSVDYLYPYFGERDLSFIKNRIYWLVDFNNRAFPKHYADDGKSQTEYQRNVVNSKSNVVLSSKALLDEMKLYYPDSKCEPIILSFASSMPTVMNEQILNAQTKFGLQKPYFMCPNQFWEHKNLIVIIKALDILRQSGAMQFLVVFTGSLDVSRGLGPYAEKLKTAIEEYKIDDWVRFLGVVDRDDQLALMKGSISLIQPSLYEGWSTLVEEAKGLNKHIILSDIPVHKEQIKQNVTFFNPHRADELANILQNQYTHPPEVEPFEYKKDVERFGRDIRNALRTVGNE